MSRLPRGGLRVSMLGTLLTAAALGLAGAARAAQQVINTPGPMTSIYLSDHLSCQVQMAGDASQAFFGGTSLGACVTYLQVASPAAGVFGPNVGATVPATNYTPVSQTLTGSGTASNPYTVATTVDAVPATGGQSIARLSEVDTYIVGQDTYDSTLTVSNPSSVASISGILYHAGDCALVNDTGFGSVDATTGAPQCALNPNNTPPGRIMSFIPVNAPGSSYIEGDVMGGTGTLWADINAGVPYPNTVVATTNPDNGMGISWPYSVPASQSQSYSFRTLVSPNPSVVPSSSSPLAVCSNSGQFPVQVSAPNGGPTLNLIVDGAAQPAIAPGPTGIATITLGPGVHTVQYLASDAVGTQESPPHTQSVGVPCSPSTSVPTASAIGTTGATFTATVNPHGLASAAHFDYGVDAGTPTVTYTSATPDQPISADLANHTPAATVTGLLPNSKYHVRAVATNAGGQTLGPDQTFTTASVPPPPPPVLGKAVNVAPVSGTVLIMYPPGQAPHALVKGTGFVPLTEARQIPVGSVLDTRRGIVSLVSASGTKRKTYAGKFQSAIFTVLQSRSRRQRGVTELRLDDNALPAAQRYPACFGKVHQTRTSGSSAPRATAARLSKRVLQLLRGKAKGSFRTRGRYSAATVRGTEWSVADRCDGTLTTVQRGVVIVTDFRRHRDVRMTAGKSYLARAG